MSLRTNDLRDLVSKKIHFDEYTSKMGKDEDVMVISFKVRYYDPALELSNFFEKGYDWILDADVSAGSLENGDWLIFIETKRLPSLPEKLVDMLEDMQAITGNKPSEYIFSYKDNPEDYVELTVENMERVMPLDPRSYKKAQKNNQQLESLQVSAGITPKTSNEFSADVKEFANLSRYR